MTPPGTSERAYEDIVIGSGQAGNPLAVALARAGRKTALVERRHLGGTCVNVGCTPTKTMVASARVAYLARRAADYGVHAGPVSVEMPTVRQRRQSVVESFRGGLQRRIAALENVDLLIGEARFVGPRALEVRLADGGSQRLRAERIYINTGCRPDRPAVKGLERVPTLDSSSIMELDETPEHLLVLGGGYVGLEFGQMFRRFGSQVTVVQRGRQLLAREDADVATAVAEILREDGLAVLLDTQAVSVEETGGRLRLVARTPDGEQTLVGTHLLVASGRVPNSDRLDLEAPGVETDARGFVKVNDRLETSAPGVYALGDVKGGPAFTHISYDDFRILRENLLEHGRASTSGRLVPYTVFIDPQLGRVGLSEAEAGARGRRIRVAKLPMAHVARAIEVGETRGFVKAVVDADSDEILGCAVLGIEGGELMAALQVAMMGRLPWMTLRDAVFAHPTLAECLNNLFASWEDR